MDHGIGVAVARAERLAEIDVGDLAVGHGVHQAQLVDIDRHAARRLADAQAIEAVEGVGPELDAGADLAELAAFSSTSEGMPFCASASAAARPPMPPPAMRISTCGPPTTLSSCSLPISRSLSPRIPDRISSVCWPSIGATRGGWRSKAPNWNGVAATG